MRTIDLGTLKTKAILVFGGPYGNFEALQALFLEAERLGISNEDIICTGDIVAYCANPLETSYYLREKINKTIQGNCERSLAEDSNNCGCGFSEGSTCDTLSQSWFSFCQSKINGEIKQWFSDLPSHLRFKLGEKQFTVVHGSPQDISEFVFSSDSNEKIKSLIQKAHTDCIISGHSGLPFTKLVGEGELCWHNAGVVGIPANDGTSRVWYSLIRKTEDGISFEHKALTYSVKKAQDKMKACGLPKEYQQTLITGLWPSIDILPKIEASQTGIPLVEKKIEWNH